MVKRTIIGRTGEEKVVDLLKELQRKASEGSTTPAGNKVLEYDEDFYWGREDGTEHSLREVDEGLADAQARIDDAEGSLAETQIRLEDAETAVNAVAEDLTHVETVVIPGAVAQLEAADQAAQQELATLDGKLATAQGELETAKGDIAQLGTDLAAESDARQQLAQDTQTTFTELDGRLADFATDEALGPIRDALTAAQQAVDAAQQVASEANTAANAASQAALEAAGIAASKGRVIVSETEPQGEDRKASNIWIKPVPDDPSTEVEEKAITYVFIEASNEWQPTTSSELAQAAQNALDAREAAQQAQQRADTAISNAAAAQAAAQAAQQTADQATIDAADAHNAAVAAQDQLDAKIAAGDSLIINGSFESGALGWPSYIESNIHPRAGIVEDPDARTGTHTLRLTPVGANVYPESTPLLAVTPGQVLNFRGWWKHLGGDGVQTRMLIRTHDAAGARISIRYPSERTDVQEWPVGEWILQEGDYVVEEGVRFLSFAPHATGASTSEYRVDDLQVIDVTDARAAQARADEAYAEAARKLDESQVDAKIAASANGKNSITISTSAPSGSGVRPGDTWWRVDGSGNIYGQWAWNGNQWTARQIRSEVIANLDVHKLQVTGSTKMAEAVIDKLWADGIAAKSITANKLVVAGGGGELIPFPDSYLPHAHFSDPGDGTIVYDGIYEKANDSRLLSSSADGQYPEGLYRIEVVAENLGDQDTSATLYHYRYKGTAYSASGYRAGTNYALPAGQKITHTAIEEIRYSPGETGFTIQSTVASPYMPIKFHSIRVTRVDQVGAVLIEDGAVSADKINAQSVAGAVGTFIEARADKLVAGEGTIGTAVIDKVWADGIAAKAIDTSRITVASGSIYRFPDLTSAPSGFGGRVVPGAGRSGGAAVVIEPSASQAGSYDSAPTEATPVEPGVQYRIGAWVKTDRDAADGLSLYAAFYSAAGSSLSVTRQDGGATEGEWTWLETTQTAPTGSATMRLGFYAQATYSGESTWSEPHVARMVGTTLIEPGAITTEKLTVTEDMSAAIVSAMSVNSKKLVVTEEAILNHATLIGQTVVDDINVQGKLIGTDGVFTGTVDFENVNVTGTQLVNKLAANSIDASKISGGSFEGKTFSGGTFNGATFRIGSGTTNSIRLGEFHTDGVPTAIAFSMYSGNGSRLYMRGPYESSGAPEYQLFDPNGMKSAALKGAQAGSSHGLYVFHSNGVAAIGAVKQGIDTARAGIVLNRWDGTRSLDMWSADGTNHSYLSINDGNGASSHRFEGNGPMNIGNDNIVYYGPSETGEWRDSVRIGPPAGPARISVHNGNSTSAGEVHIEGVNNYVNGTTDFYFGSSSYLRLRQDSSGDQFACNAIYTRTSSGSANVYVTSYGTLARSTSSRRYKKNIADWSPSPEAVLALQPRQWQHDAENAEIDERWHVGFIAEEVDELGLKGLVDYAGDGAGGWRPESLRYDRFAAAQQVVLQKHEAEIQELRERIALLEAQIGTE